MYFQDVTDSYIENNSIFAGRRSFAPSEVQTISVEAETNSIAGNTFFVKE